MFLYNTSSFGTRRRLLGRRLQTRRFGRAPGPALPERILHISDETVGEDVRMATNNSIRDHLAIDPDNISIVFRAGESYRVSNTRRSDFSVLRNDLYVFECTNPVMLDGELEYDEEDARLANLRKLGLSIREGFIDMSRGRFTNEHRVYFLEPTRVISRVVDYRVLYGDGGDDSHSNCRPDSGGQVYDLYPAVLAGITTTQAFGRRRQQKGRRTSTTRPQRRRNSRSRL